MLRVTLDSTLDRDDEEKKISKRKVTGTCTQFCNFMKLILCMKFSSATKKTQRKQIFIYE